MTEASDLDEEDDKVISFIEKMNTEHMLVVINKEDLGRSVTKRLSSRRLPGVRIISTPWSEREP